MSRDMDRILRGMDNGTRVYVGGVHRDVRERDIEHFFRGYGRIREVVLKSGFAFVEFEDNRDADDAIHDLNGKDLCGDRVTLELSRRRPRGGSGGGGGRSGGYGGDRYGSRRSPYRGPPARSRYEGGGGRYGPPTQTRHRVRVENLSSRVSWQDLKDFMRQAGEVTYADAHRDRKNEGIVCFASYDEMKSAIRKLDGKELEGRQIKVIEDGRRSRSRSRSRSPRSRSRDRSRSRSSRSGSRSRSRSPRSRSRSPGAVRGKSGSASPKRRSPEPPTKNGDVAPADKSMEEDKKDDKETNHEERTSRSRSRSRSSRSGSE